LDGDKEYFSCFELMRIYGHVKAQRQVPFEDVAVNAGREILTFSQCLQEDFFKEPDVDL